MRRISTENPFQLDSKLHAVFNFMKDGEQHALSDITKAAYPGWVVSGDERRTASALRTIRATPGLDVGYGKFSKTYQMFDCWV